MLQSRMFFDAKPIIITCGDIYVAVHNPELYGCRFRDEE